MTGFTCYVYDFSVDYGAPDIDDVVDIHKCLDLLINCFL